MTDAPKTIWAYAYTGTERKGQWHVSPPFQCDEYTLTSSVQAQLKAADELAEAVDHERNMVCQDMGLQQMVSEAVDSALTAYRKAKEQGQ